MRADSVEERWMPRVAAWRAREAARGSMRPGLMRTSTRWTRPIAGVGAGACTEDEAGDEVLTAKGMNGVDQRPI
jgi:hypothetical protein